MGYIQNYVMLYKGFQHAGILVSVGELELVP